MPEISIKLITEQNKPSQQKYSFFQEEEIVWL